MKSKIMIKIKKLKTAATQSEPSAFLLYTARLASDIPRPFACSTSPLV